MARVNWLGTEIEATLIDQLPNGNYRMKAHGRAPRIEPGTVIEVTQKQIVGLTVGSATFLGPGAQAQVAGQAATAAGATSTSVIPPAPTPVAANDAAQAAPVVVSTPARIANFISSRTKPMSNITGASQLGASAQARIAAAKAKIAAANEKVAGAMKNLDVATASIEDVAAKVEQEAADLTSATATLTNGPGS